jgi:AraC-like DNA-binding protein
MVIYKDNRILNKSFPFEISQIQLNKADNLKDSFHWHNFCEITYVQRGEGSYFVNGKQYDMKEGDLIIFNNAEPHGWFLESQQMYIMVMIFSMDLISKLNSDYLKPFIERGSNFKNKIESDDTFIFEIVAMMKEIYKEFNKKVQGYELLIMADVLRILTFFIRYYQNSSEVGLKPETLDDKKNTMKRIEEAFYYINKHYTEKITLGQVAKSVYMSENYFSSYFKKVANINFMDYVTELRLKKAKELMHSTDLNMNEIALESGFPNLSNFYRIYKKRVGELPKHKKETKSNSSGSLKNE